MTVHEQIRRRIETFAVELEALVRAAAIDAVRSSLGAGPSVRAARPAAARMQAASNVPVSTGSAKPMLSFKRKKGAKRSPEQLAQIDAAVLGYVKANAGKGIEAIAKGLGASSSDLKLRVSLLVDGRKLKKTGVKRATKYFAA